MRLDHNVLIVMIFDTPDQDNNWLQPLIRAQNTALISSVESEILNFCSICTHVFFQMLQFRWAAAVVLSRLFGTPEFVFSMKNQRNQDDFLVDFTIPSNVSFIIL